MNNLIFCILLFLTSSAFSLNIAIEGNTGAGKSTLAKLLVDRFSAAYVPEPFTDWLDVNGHGNLFANFLADAPHWSPYLCTYSAITKLNALKKAKLEHPNSRHFFVDRSLLADEGAFVPFHRESGFLADDDFHEYEKFMNGDAGFGFSCPTQDPLKAEVLRQAAVAVREPRKYEIDLVIYLHTSPQVCKERADKRDRELRDADSGPQGTFYEKLGAIHDAWLGDKKEVLWRGQMIPVLHINGDVDFIHDHKQLDRIVRQVSEALHDMQSEY